MAVAPTVSTKRAILRGRPRFCSATRSDTGRLALDEAVEKATTMASRMPRKNFSGDMPPKVATQIG
ncbi:hypothetical protein D3C81_1965980 [compost metagenome]